MASTHSTDLPGDEGIRTDEVIILRPESGGTTASHATDTGQVAELVRSGLSIAEAAVPLTRPPKVEQLSLFGK
jgi:hypothetical protein